MRDRENSEGFYLTLTCSREACAEDFANRSSMALLSETLVLRLGGNAIDAVAGEILVHRKIITRRSISQTAFPLGCFVQHG